jgi:LmbE family N-acetylglucosaminyl deacetylase
MKHPVLAIAAHPDDIEFMMAGTLLMLAQAGFELHIFVVATGSCGTAVDDRDVIVRKRLAEARAAADSMGARFYEPIVDDLEIGYTVPLLRKVCSVVRQAQPEILLTQSPDDYMEDHEYACRLAVSAAFARGMRNFITEPEIAPLSHPVRLYHALPYGLCDGMNTRIVPEIYVNISSVLQEKRTALACHVSQKEWLDESQGLDSYLQTMEDMGREVGRWSDTYEYAEGWRRHGHLGFCAPEFDPLVEALGVQCQTK